MPTQPTQGQPAYPQPTQVQSEGVAVQIAYPQAHSHSHAVTSLDDEAKSFKNHRCGLCFSLILDVFSEFVL